MTKRIVVIAAVCMWLALSCFASDADDRAKDVKRLESAGEIIREIMNTPDKGIPEEIAGSAKCIAVVPHLIKGAFIFGGEYGQGVASCRTNQGWSAPAFFGMGGGSFGFQIGGEGIDLVMVIMNNAGMERLLHRKFKIGADASAAAGPVGRHAQAGTDWSLSTEILTYSRAKGLFAGISLNGVVVSQNSKRIRSFYGRNVPFRTILTGQVASPSDSAPFTGEVARYFIASKGK